MAYLYALIESAGPPVPSLEGIDGRPVDMLELGPVSLAVGALTARPQASLTAIGQHQAVLEALMDRGALLPFRFATVVPDPEVLASAVRSDLPAITGNLADVAGCVELGLTAGPMPACDPRPDPPAPAPTSSPGRDYLLRLCHDAEGRREGVPAGTAGLERLDRDLRALARRSSRLPRSASENLFRAAYLVPRGSVQAFKATVTAAIQAQAAPPLLASGPWPPYSFVRAGLLDPATRHTV